MRISPVKLKGGYGSLPLQAAVEKPIQVALMKIRKALADAMQTSPAAMRRHTPRQGEPVAQYA
jgi:hypothetical protein